MLEMRIPRSPAPILVTGGAGFIGSHLVDRLLAAGERVVVLDDFNDFYDPAIKRANVAPHLSNPAYTLVEGDIRDAATLERIFSVHGIRKVVHLAARAGVRPSLDEPELYESVNIAGTLAVLEACRRHKVEKLVFGSSSSVYGENPKVPFAESDMVANPISPYAATKAAGELFCHTYAHLYRLPVVCLRFFTVYGPRQRPDLAIHKFARLIQEGSPIPVFGNGQTERDYTFVDDIVTGIVAALDYDRSPFEIINLGNSRTVPLNRLIAVIEQAVGRQAIIEWRPPQPGDVPRTFADTSKAARLLGYAPDTAIEDGVAKFAAWLQESAIALR
jgi:UDP-glucuronate 4-epimerase